MAVVMLFTICVFGGNRTAEAAATTPVAKHGRLSVKGADLVDSKEINSSFAVSAHMESTGMSDRHM